MTRPMRNAHRWIWLALAVALPLAFVAGCDPCAGTLNCSTAPRVTVTGTVVNHATGAPVAGGSGAWTVATWLVARAHKYSVHTISYGGYRWSVKTSAWRYIGGGPSQTVVFS